MKILYDDGRGKFMVTMDVIDFPALERAGFKFATGGSGDSSLEMRYFLQPWLEVRKTWARLVNEVCYDYQVPALQYDRWPYSYLVKEMEPAAVVSYYALHEGGWLAGVAGARWHYRKGSRIWWQLEVGLSWEGKSTAAARELLAIASFDQGAVAGELIPVQGVLFTE